jgi:hypothetical protein
MQPPRKRWTRDEFRTFAHPYFAKMRYDVDRSIEDVLFLVQRPPSGVTITRDPRKIAEFYGGPMRKMEDTFDRGFVTKMGFTRRADYVSYTVVILTDEDEYHAYGQTTEQMWRMSGAYYDPRLAVIVAYGDPFSSDTTPARQRRLVLSEFARALQHAYYQGRDDRPVSLWLNLGFASWFGYREGVLAEAQDKTAIDTDALAEVVKIAQDKEERELELHPVIDLLGVRNTADIVLLAKNRAEAQHSSEPAPDRALRAFYMQAALWVHFLHDSQGGRYREPFLKFFQSSMSGLGGLDAFYLAFFQNPQQFRLHRHRHVADLVQKQRSAVGFLKLADLVVQCAGQASLAVAEQFALNQFFGNSRAVDLDEGLAGAGAGGVDRVRDQFLARAAFSENEHAPVGGRHQPQLLPQRLHRNALPDNAELGVAGFLEPVEFEFEPPLLDCVMQHHGNLFDGQRLFEKIESSELGRSHRGFDSAVPRNDHHFRAIGERNFLDPRQRLEAVHARQPDIQQHDIVVVAGQLFETRLPAFHGATGEALVFEHPRQ